MKKIIVTSLLYFFSISTQASFAKIKILIKSGMSDVTVTARSNPFIIEDSGTRFVIREAVVKTSELEVKPAMASGKMKKEKFLNVEQYPEIKVENINCDEVELNCHFDLTIKGKQKEIVAAFSQDGAQLRMKFTILLSDFDIARKISLWNIENQAQATVDITK